MRGNKYYTVPTPKIREAPEEKYAEILAELSFFQRLILRIRSLMYGLSWKETLQRQMLAAIADSMAAEVPDLFDAQDRALGEPFFVAVTRLSRQSDAVSDAVRSILWPLPFGYLRFLLSRYLPELDAAATKAMQYTYDFSVLHRSPVDAASAEVSRSVVGMLRGERRTIERALSSYWRSAAVINEVIGFSFAGIVSRAGGSVGRRVAPLKLMLPSLIRLHQLRFQVARHWNEETAGLISDYCETLHPVSAADIDLLMSGVRGLRTSVRLLDLIRLAVEDPLADLDGVSLEVNWFEETVAAYEDRIHPYLAARALRTLKKELEEIISGEFAVSLSTMPALPRELPGMATGTALILNGTEAFRAQHRAVLQLVIDAEFEKNGTRELAHRGINAIESACDELAEFFVTTPDRTGTVDEYLRKLEQSGDGPGAISRSRKAYLESIATKVSAAIRLMGESMLTVADVVAGRESGGDDLGTISYGNVTVQGVRNAQPIEFYLESIERSWRPIGVRLVTLLHAELEN